MKVYRRSSNQASPQGAKETKEDQIILKIKNNAEQPSKLETQVVQI
jgi:hypothetical protein